VQGAAWHRILAGSDLFQYLNASRFGQRAGDSSKLSRG
jgi:hypothetical protein